MIHVIQLAEAHHHHCDEAHDEHERAEQTEEMHGLRAEPPGEPQRGKVEIAVDEPVEPELGLSVLPRLVLHHLLPYPGVSGVLCQIRYVTVHVAIHLDMLHHLIAVSLKPAVEIVQIPYAAHLACCGIEELGRDSLRQRVITFLLPARHKVVAVAHDHTVQFRDLVGRILKVGIHSDHHIPLGKPEAGVQGGRLAVVAAERRSAQSRIPGGKAVYHLP